MATKVLIFTNQADISLKLKQQLTKLLVKRGVVITSEAKTADYLVTIGGDGTLLSAFHCYQSFLDKIQFIGIHTGHLGFYADWQAYELDDLVEGILKIEQKKPVSYPLLQIEVILNDDNKYHYLALNECSIRSHTGTMVSDIYIKNRFFETLRSDGICVATPTGSTGLNKSLGGAVIHPRLDALQLTEMAPLNNRVYRSLGSPIIISKDEWFYIEPSINGQENNFMLMFDNVTVHDLSIKAVRMQIATQRIHFANIRHTHFWDRVETSFIGRNYKQQFELNHLLK